MSNQFFIGCEMRASSRQRALRYLTLIFCCAFALQTLITIGRAQGLTGKIKGTVSATSGDASTRPELLPGANLTLINRDVPTAIFKTVSDETGNFAFLELPAGTYIVTAETKGLLTVKREIALTTGATLKVDIIMAPTVSELVTIREEEGLLSAGESTTSNTIRAAKLEQLPLRADNYQGD